MNPTQRPQVVERVVLSTQLDPYLSLGALSDYASISVRQLRNLIASPIHPLPHYRLRSRILVRKGEFDAWASQHRHVGVDIEERVDRLRARERRHRADGVPG